MTQEYPALKRVTIITVSVALTALIASLAFLLGAWGFNTRRYSQHADRLRRLLEQHPKLPQVVQAFQDEGSPLVAAPRDSAELQRVAEQWAGPRAGEVVEKAARWPQTRVFVAGDMVYFIFFDEQGVMRDYTFVSRRAAAPARR
jgi:hypothetical protein